VRTRKFALLLIGSTSSTTSALWRWIRRSHSTVALPEYQQSQTRSTDRVWSSGSRRTSDSAPGSSS